MCFRHALSTRTMKRAQASPTLSVAGSGLAEVLATDQRVQGGPRWTHHKNPRAIHPRMTFWMLGCVRLCHAPELSSKGTATWSPEPSVRHGAPQTGAAGEQLEESSSSAIARGRQSRRWPQRSRASRPPCSVPCVCRRWARPPLVRELGLRVRPDLSRAGARPLFSHSDTSSGKGRGRRRRRPSSRGR